MEVSTKPNPQKAHYEAIHDAYEAHYYDAPSMAYRDRFIYGPLVERLDLSEASLADLACGSGHNSAAARRYLPGIRTTGYDISEAACQDYVARTGRPAHVMDLTVLQEPQEVHDAATSRVVGARMTDARAWAEASADGG